MCYHGKLISEYSINGNIISCSSSCKDLGIHFSDDLSINSSSLAISILFPKRIKLWAFYAGYFKDNCTETRKCLYISIVRSKLLYCLPLWKPYLLSDIDLVTNYYYSCYFYFIFTGTQEKEQDRCTGNAVHYYYYRNLTLQLL